MDNTSVETLESQDPKVFIKSITFNDGTTIQLDNSSIIVFTGANNCGKSQVLRDIDRYLQNDGSANPKVLSSLESEFIGTIADVEKLFEHGDNGNLIFAQSTLSPDNLKIFWDRKRLTGYSKLFIGLLNTEQRLITSNRQQALDFTKEQPQHPIHTIYLDDDIAKIISDYFYKAFSTDLIVSKGAGAVIPLYVGDRPTFENGEDRVSSTYMKKLSALPLLEQQGDGMRSFASVLLDTFTSHHTVTLIDEPEAFLHPPQARLLGKMLAKSNPAMRQLFISTHSEDFLNGLLDADNENVKVIRIDRVVNINKMSVLSNDKVKELWNNPLLRYSNILSGLFHEKVVVCESDYDCLFFQAIIDAIYDNSDEIAPDIMFTHCGGKDRLDIVVAALKALDVTVMAVADFDVLNNSTKLKDIVSAFGIDWDSQLSSPMKTIYDMVNGKQGGWESLKRVGKAGFEGDAPSAYDAVETICISQGFFVVPCGEIECFDRTVNKSKKEWVYNVLENYDLMNEPKLSVARDFVKSIIEFKPLTIITEGSNAIGAAQ